MCAKLDSPQRLQDLLPWLLEVFVQRSLEMQKVCEREKSLLKDQAGNLGTRLLFLYHIVVTKVLAIEELSVI